MIYKIQKPKMGELGFGHRHLHHFLTDASCGGILSLNQDLLDQGRDCFRKNYRDLNYSASFTQDLTVSWLVFYNAIINANNALPTPIPLNRLALKFIHRYNADTSRWFLTVQLCQISGSRLTNSDPGRRYESFTLVSTQTYFNLKDDGTIGVETGSGLGFINGYEYGLDYFSNVFYGASKVMPGRNIQSVTFALKELQKLHDDNVIAGSQNDDAKFSILFSSASSQTDIYSDDTFVEYPHCMMVYMQYSTSNCLDDNNIILGNFYNRAADYNTLCPRRCNVYLCPIEIIQYIE